MAIFKKWTVLDDCLFLRHCKTYILTGATSESRPGTKTLSGREVICWWGWGQRMPRQHRGWRGWRPYCLGRLLVRLWPSCNCWRGCIFIVNNDLFRSSTDWRSIFIIYGIVLKYCKTLKKKLKSALHFWHLTFLSLILKAIIKVKRPCLTLHQNQFWYFLCIYVSTSKSFQPSSYHMG